MNTRNYLGQLDRLEKMIVNKQEEICRLRTIACSVSISFDDVKVQTSGDKDVIGAVVAKIIDMESEIGSMIDKRDRIVKQIESINDTDLYDVLAKRYILGKTNKEIAFEINKTQETACRVLKAAHDEFEKKYGSEYLIVQN